MRRRRGQTSVQFNWIFALIAGAVILGFFITVVVKQRASAETQAAGALASRMESLMASAKVSTGKASYINLRDVDLLFDCENYRIGNQGAVEIGNKAVFSPNRIRGDGLVLWSQPWKMPFEVTNFLYLTNPSVKYVLIGDSQSMKDLNKSLPNILNKELVKDIDQATFRNEKKLRIVCEGTCPKKVGDFSSLNPSDITMVEISDLEAEFGAVKFYSYADNFNAAEESAFLGKASMYGAIFAEEKELYECNMQDALTNLNLITRMYWLRTGELAKVTSLSDNCVTIYSLAEGAIFPKLAEDSLKVFDPVVALEIENGISLLKDNYNKKLQGFSCPVIY